MLCLFSFSPLWVSWAESELLIGPLKLSSHLIAQFFAKSLHAFFYKQADASERKKLTLARVKAYASEYSCVGRFESVCFDYVIYWSTCTQYSLVIGLRFVRAILLPSLTVLGKWGKLKIFNRKFREENEMERRFPGKTFEN